MNDISIIGKFIENMADAMLISNESSEIIYVNSACSDLFGYSLADFTKLKIDDLIPKPENRDHLNLVKNFIHSKAEPIEMMNRSTIPCINSSGKKFDAKISISNVEIGNAFYAFAAIHDYTNFKEQLASFEKDSNIDMLTNLHNKRYLERIIQANGRVLKKWESIGILYLDLDKFKPVNDNLGHDAGDSVLKIISSRLKESVRYDDLVFRVGGDEFLIFLNLTDNKEKSTLISKVSSLLLNKISQTIYLQEEAINLEVSIGAGLFPDDETDIKKLIDLTDKAMYESKKSTSFVTNVSELKK